MFSTKYLRISQIQKNNIGNQHNYPIFYRDLKINLSLNCKLLRCHLFNTKDFFEKKFESIQAHSLIHD
jgi:hypothetical protein